jgi:uncharacterized protein (PEP-CTERM system associated)
VLPVWPLLWAPCAAVAQFNGAAGAAPAGALALRIEPNVSLRQTISHSSPGSTVMVTQLSPGIRVHAQRGRVRGHLDYSLQGLVYGNDRDDSDLRHSLDAAGSAELIENRLYLDASASIGQRAISAFGQQVVDPVLPNANQTQVLRLNVSPRLRGLLFGEIEYTARASQSIQRAGEGKAFDSDVSSASLTLSGGSGLQVLTWSLDASANRYDFGVTRLTQARLVRAQINYAVTDSLRASVIGGAESNNFLSLDMRTSEIVGGSLDWRPSPRTRVFLQQERRFFGTGHQVAIEYRTPRTTFSFTSSRDISTPQEQQALAAIGTVFDLFFAQFATVEPDPVARRLLVLNFLLNNGIAPNTPVFGSLLTSGLTLSNTQQLTATWRALRGTASISANQSDSRRLVAFAAAPDDFSNSTVVQQRGLVASYNHRLSPLESLAVAASYNQSRGDLTSLRSSLRSVQATYSAQVSPKTSGSLAARVSSSSFSGGSRMEYALIGSVAMRY